MINSFHKHGGSVVAKVLKNHDVKHVFTLCGGHISPILTGCNELGIQVVDVRHEATAVFAAEAISRLSNRIGVAVVTAGPGLTNTITAIKNAQMAQVPILILGGATATVLKGRGSLQDINHLKLVESITKLAITIKRVKDIQPNLDKAIHMANSDTPGPIFIEFPVDVLYPEKLVREWYGLKSDDHIMPWWLSKYLNWNVNRIFKNKNIINFQSNDNNQSHQNSIYISRASDILKKAHKPVLLVGSQAMLNTNKIDSLADAIKKLDIPTYVSGMARGLLSVSDLPTYRHYRKKSLREADVVMLAGVPCDFRLDYGRHINHEAKIISVNLNKQDLYRNRKPHHGVLENPGTFLIKLNHMNEKRNWPNWHEIIRDREQDRCRKILSQSKEESEYINPLKICMSIDQHLEKGDIIISDGGDFVATASYILKPRSLLGWLDPGVFGTLGVGAGFIMGAKLTNPDSVIWAIYGDGAFGYSLMEFDTFVRHSIPVIAIVGNDSGWTQIARDQVDILKDPISTKLKPTKYHAAVEALGGVGLSIESDMEIEPILLKAKELAKSGKSVLVNVRIGKTNFRKGSISI